MSMGSESDSSSQDGRDDVDEDESEDVGGGNRLLGFMFGNVDGAGDLDVDYLDEDAKEHLAALADKLGPSLTDIDLSVKSSRTPVDTAEQDYDEKAEDAVDYEDIDEQYDGPEIQTATEEDYLLPKKDYFATEIPLATLEQKTSVFDDENYDDDEEEFEKGHELDDTSAEVQNRPSSGKLSDTFTVFSEGGKCHGDELKRDSFETENLAGDLADFEEEEPEVLEELFDDNSSMPLPLLCVEDGAVILRFSEIFGNFEPLKKQEKRDRKYTITKDKYKSMDSSDIVEEDEEGFLKGSCQGFPFIRHSHVVQDDVSEIKDDDDLESEQFGFVRGAPMVAPQVNERSQDSYLIAEPMKEDTPLDLSAEWCLPLSSKFYPLDQQNWEDHIIWNESPAQSDNAAESCETSGPDFEEFSSTQTELEARPQNNLPELQMEPVENHHGVLPRICPILVEPFGSKECSNLTNQPSSVSRYHPQLLRLESRLERPDDNAGRKDDVTEENRRSDAVKLFSKLALQNRDMMEGSWLDRIIWEPHQSNAKPRLILDLQDEQMLFEVLDNKDGKHIRLHAGAMFITRSVKSSGGDPMEPHGHGGPSGARFNIANDKFYSNRKISQQLKSHSKKRAAHGVKVLHSIPALKLQTMKPKLSNKDIANFHRPKALWYPHDNEVALKEQGKLLTQGPMKIILKSLGGKGSKLHVDAEETISSVKTKASKKLDFKPLEPVKILYSGRELEDDKSLTAQNVRPNSLLHLVRTNIHLLPRAQKVPGENKSLRPPGAFKKKSDLSVKDGHIFLMEYCEERPLLLGNAGMGARLCTHYQKSAPGDQTGTLLRNGNNSLGSVLILDPADKSPFLGDIKAGCSQSCLETNMYRAPIFPHKVSSTDYLLVRSAKGKLSIRRIDRLDVVGQQEPHMEVMSPGSKGVQAYIMNRLLVYMYREFRAVEKRGLLPCIRADELSAQFPTLYEAFLRKRLKHCADLQRGSNGQLFWVMRRNFRIPLEEELRRMVTPENVCAYESMQAGLYRLKRLGITRLTNPSGLSSAMNQLPDEAIALAAASHIERELQITPWNLSSNFVACTSQDRENIERLEITGVGDPSGRGLGFSYVRTAPKAPVSNAMVKKKAAVNRGGSTVTGTDADLRRLSMDAAREVLLKFNVPEEQIKKQTRWHRIAMIRKLSSEQAASGIKVDPTTISKYARGQRMSFLQLQQQTREKCQEIWDRQIQSLSAVDGDEYESDSEANSDLDSFAGDLENLLDAEECEEGEEGNYESKHDKVDGVRGLKMRRRPLQAQVDEEFEDEAAEAAELCRMLMDDDEAELKKKKKTRTAGDEVGVTPEREEKLLAKKNLSGKVKAMKKIDTESMGLLNKKVKILGDGIKIIKEKKSARESFVCGACGQLGHMRTNKNCPKYGEDLESQVEGSADLEKVSVRSKNSADRMGQPPQRTVTKKLVPKSATKMALVEVSEDDKPSSKAKILKVKCGSIDKLPDKPTPATSQSSDRPVTSDAETGSKPAVKVNKIIFSNKMKPEEVQVESHKPSIVIKPPVETERDQPRKKIVIKRPKEIINLDQGSQEGSPGLEYRKMKKIIDLSTLEKRSQHESKRLAEEATRRKIREDKRLWEEEEKRRIAERDKEERARRLHEQRRILEEQERLAEITRYEEVIRIEREEEELQKAKKKKKKRSEPRDDYLDDLPRRNDRRMPERDRTIKRRPVVELGNYGAEYAPPTKRRRGGEVGLANILESIVDSLKDRHEVSYLFLKPVSKKEAPDYLKIVKHPMDLSTIREKVRKLEYRCREEFRHDVWQITYNAHKYNDGRNPGIPPLADQLLELCDYLLNQNDPGLTEAEAGINCRDT
ncbi:Transcription initiation factor TFIID subunit like [Actinidia chinensis var. chinensis]|uniref:Transcription initiation factor TFIID subunit 1 n=1 Tax=Actinidia chinensis var. chinensis TaxID=1590841 RepID=A0A2R6RCD3_ACTCC|nr:Transcription initiation factor TFIID subunit like [Actinidia chinensis var. chinensis]